MNKVCARQVPKQQNWQKTKKSLGLKCGFIMLNLKQKLCQSSRNEMIPPHFPRSLSCLPATLIRFQNWKQARW